jgi:hypothetical protein
VPAGHADDGVAGDLGEDLDLFALHLDFHLSQKSLF